MENLRCYLNCSRLAISACCSSHFPSNTSESLTEMSTTPLLCGYAGYVQGARAIYVCPVLTPTVRNPRIYFVKTTQEEIAQFLMKDSPYYHGVDVESHLKDIQKNMAEVEGTLGGVSTTSTIQRDPLMEELEELSKQTPHK